MTIMQTNNAIQLASDLNTEAIKESDNCRYKIESFNNGKSKVYCYEINHEEQTKFYL